MSWPQWQGGVQSGVSGLPVVNPTPAVINPSPAAMPMNMQYTPEQWQQMQQQNWQQWAQWQQQYQQWHQQYGAEYQKTLSAMANAPTAPVPPVPLTSAPPPLPIEAKPPLPPEEPPPHPVQQPNKPPNFQGYTSVLSQPPPTTNFNNPQQEQNVNKHVTKPPVWKGQLMTTPPPNMNPQKLDLPKPDINNKRPFSSNQPEFSDSKRNKFEQNWQTQPPPNYQPPNSNEELSESEKKFMKQFAEWEAQFNKWKEQNQDHPDKAQYKEYEKKWEAWRNQLLDRREQMRRRRLGLPNSLQDTKPMGKQPPMQHPFPAPNLNKARTNANPDPFKDKPPNFTSEPYQFNKPPNYNNDPLQFKDKPPNLNELRHQKPPNFNSETMQFSPKLSYNTNPPTQEKVSNYNKELSQFKDKPDNASQEKLEEGNSFLKSSTSGGIPGLDLVDETEPNKEEVPEEVIDLDKPHDSVKIQGPDLEALSKNINSILGDQKLLSMLNLVSQKQGANTSSKTSENTPLQTQDSLSEHGSNVDEVSRTSFNQEDSRSQFAQSNKSENFDFQQNKPMGGINPNTSQWDEEYNMSGDHFVDNWNRKQDNGPPNMGRGRGGFNKFAFQDKGHTSTFEPPDSFNENEPFGKYVNRELFDDSEPKNNYNNVNQFNQGPLDRGGRKTFFDRDPDDRNFEYGRDDHRFPEESREENLNRYNDNRGNNFRNDFNNRNVDMDYDGNNQKPSGFDRNNKWGKNNSEEFDQDPDNFNRGFSRDRPDNFYRNSDQRNQNQNDQRFNRDQNDQRVDNFNSDSNNRLQDNFNKGRFTDRRSDNFMGRPNEGRFSNFDGPNEAGRTRNFGGSGDNYDYDEYARDSNDYDKEDSYGHFQDYDDGNNEYYPADAPYMSDPLPAPEEPNLAHEAPTADEILNIEKVIDYEHKPKKTAIVEVSIEPPHLFDYRHKPVNRIPLPDRPKWLAETFRNLPEFEPSIGRPPMLTNYGRYPPIERFDYRSGPTYDRYNDYATYNRRSFDDRRYPDDRRNIDDRRNVDDRRNCDDRRNVDDRRSMDDRRNVDDRRGMDDRRSIEDRRNIDDRRNTDDRRYPNDSHISEYDRNRRDRRSADFDYEPQRNREMTNSPSVSNKQNMSKPITKIINNTSSIDDILNPPGRFKRQSRIVIILRGPPGSGKTFLAKLIKDKEVENGGSAPRILSLDDYFMVEQEKEIVEDGKKIIIKEMVYEYEESMEASYRTSLLKSFKKTITDGYFPFIIVDNVNDKIKYFSEMWSFAKQNGFEVYVCQLELDVQVCSKRNIHNRSEAEIEHLVAGWEQTPNHHCKLDATNLIQAGSIPEVEMEEINSPNDNFDDEENEEQACNSSKWDNFECSIDNLAKLDGINKPLRPAGTMEDYLQLDEWTPKCSKPGQKRVRWADLEERKEQEKMRAIGFVVGQTDWDRMMDPTQGSSALTKTKYIERVRRY